MARDHSALPVHQLLTLAQDLFHFAPADAERDVARTRFNQCVLLAVLLHIWLVLVLGSAPGGQAAPGQGSYGSLMVKLQGPVAQAGADVAEEPQSSGPPGKVRQQRSGGMVRPIDEPVRQDQAGAETAGAWRALESPNDPNLAPPVAPEVKPLSSSALDAAPELPRPTATLTDSAQAVTDTRVQALTKLQTEHAPSLAPLPGTAYDALRPALTLKDVAQRAAPAPGAAPSKLAPSRTTDLAPLPTQDFDALRARTLSEPTVRAAPAAAAMAAPAKLPSLDAPKLAPLPSNALDALQPMRTSTLGESAPPGQAVQPAPTPETVAAPARLPSTRAPDLPALPAADLPSGPSASTASTAAPRPAIGNAPQGPSANPSPTPGGAPNAGAQQGHDVATAPSASSDKKPLNLNLPLARGPMAASHGGSGLLPVVPKPPDTKGTIEKAVEKGRREDCRKAYADNGLLAALPLAADAARDKGCKW